VAIAWQVYDLSNAPTALSVVGVAWTLPMVLFLLVGGVLGDRFDRRHLLIASDALRGLAIACIGGLSLAGAIELWHVIALVALYGVGQALFAPSFQAIIPDVVPRDLLVQANSLQQLTEPVAYRLVGPALGGALVAGLGVGTAFLVDAATFGVSIAAVARMRPQRLAPRAAPASALREVREGFAFVRSRAWLWGTLAAAAISLMLFLGPFQVLLPYIVKNQLGGGAEVLGLVFAASGVGAVASALAVGQRGVGRRHVLWMYLAWALSVASLAGYGVASNEWQAMAIALVSGAAFTVGNITWATLLHTHVPGEVLGRVSALDWLVSIGLTPVSFALAGPAAAALGVEATMIGAGALAASATLSFLLVPGIRDPEREVAEPVRAAA
jgi:hypothetical protein